MEGVDGKLSLKEKKNQMKLDESLSQSLLQSSSKLSSKEVKDLDQNNDNDTSGKDFTEDPNFEPPSRNTENEELINLQLPRDAMKQISPLAYRLKLSA